MKKKISGFLSCFLLITMLFPLAVHGDTGPKPSVHITFENMDSGQQCYGTLLSKVNSTGPASAWDGISEYHHYEYGEEGRDVWNAFVSYEDSDGFYFLQEWWDCSENSRLDWTYYPPQTFKILLYYPETDTFAVSGIYERYAFDSYFTVDMDGVEIGAVNTVNTQEPILVANESYDYTWELISLACRMVITIALEVGVALLFGFREKRQILWITGVNIATQAMLNTLLNAVNYYQGSYAFVAFYILLEAAVFAIEAALYCALLPRVSRAAVIRKRNIVLYALAANACSFIGGMVIAKVIPGIF